MKIGTLTIKKKKTILRQLLLNITTPVVLVLVLFSYINYYYNKTELANLNRERLLQIQQEVQNLVEVHDFGMKMNERHFEGRMQKVSYDLVTYFSKNHDPATTNLYELSEKMGLDTNFESIYIIDTNGVVVNTSFYLDLHLNFYARGAGYREYFEKIWAQDTFIADRFSTEQVTGRIKKWSFVPTSDKRYLIELGFLSEEARIMRETLFKKVDEIADKHNDIERVFLAMQVKGENFDGIEDSLLQSKMQEVLLTRKNQRIITEDEDRTIYEDLIYVEVLLEETSMFNGVILYVKSDDSKERALVNTSVQRFAAMAVIAVLILIVIITLRARTITRPIIRLKSKAEIISSGKLDERIDLEGNNEITQLSHSFNNMVEQLQESYQTLEQKVIDRTAEVVEQKNEAEHQRHLVEEKQKEILDSINYAKRIQKAILPPERLVKELLPDSFILYKPKDIVAGDFYWLESFAKASDSEGIKQLAVGTMQSSETTNSSDQDRLPTPNCILVAAADCTGHGVPGALVSVVCHNALNRSVREYGISDPGKILDKTRDIVISEFEKSDDVVKDGMDISLLAIQNERSQFTKTSDVEKGSVMIQWSGANNPLWILRNGSSEIEEIKANKQPIGKYADPKPFTTHKINLEKGDTIYIFTDGYADQFGGDRGKKFKAACLKELLLSIQSFSMSEQKEKINQAFEDWRGIMEQVDDVCIIGIRL